MSSGVRVPLMDAREIAGAWMTTLNPLCWRVQVAGSIRRQKPDVGDIEICAVPNSAKAVSLANALNAPTIGNFLSADEAATMRRLTVANKQGWVKNKALELAARERRALRVKGSFPGHYIQLALPEGIALDLFLPSEAAWGLVYMIRTGSAEFSAAMASRSKRMGYIWHEGRVYKRGPGDVPEGAPFALPEEEDVFRFFEVPWVRPEDRRDESALHKAEVIGRGEGDAHRGTPSPALRPAYGRGSANGNRGVGAGA